MLLRSKGAVVSDRGKVILKGDRLCIEQMSESKPADDASLGLQGTVKTGVYQVLREQSGRDLLTDPAAVGVKAA